MVINDDDIIKTAFSGQTKIAQKVIAGELRKHYPDLPYTSIRWKIYHLKEIGLLRHLTRGYYSLQAKPSFQPDITPEQKTYFTELKQELPFLSICTTHSKWLNELMLHQAFKTYLIVEVEKDAMNRVYRYFIDQNKAAFINPDIEMLTVYIDNAEAPIIIKPIQSESPLQETKGIIVPTIEKLLVDILSDTVIYSAQYEERLQIYKSAFEKYSINRPRLRRYARRRNREDIVNELMN